MRPDRCARGQLIGAAVGFAGLLLFMNPGLVDWSDPRVLAGNAMLLLCRDLLGARLGALPAARLAFELLDPDILAARGQHAGGCRVAAPVGIRRTDALDPDTRSGPGLQLGRHDRARVFSVEQGSGGDAGRRSRGRSWR